MNVFLISLPLPSFTRWRISPALPILKEYLIRNDYSVKCINLDGKYLRYKPFNLSIFFNKKEIKKFLDYDVQNDIRKAMEQLCKYFDINKIQDIVGFSANNFQQFLMSLCMATHLRRRTKKKLTIVFGGPFFDYNPEKILQEYGRTIDYIIYGFGEVALLQLCRSLEGKEKSITNIPGLVYQKDKTIYRNPPLSRYRYDKAYIDYSGVIEDYKHLKGFFLNNIALCYPVGSGCIGRCKFCADAGTKVHFTDANKIAKALSRIVNKTGLNHFFFACNAINIDRELLVQFCHALKKVQPIRWEAYACPLKMDLELCSLLAESGCKAITLGVEGGSKTIFQKIGKPGSPKSVEETMANCKKVNIKPCVDLLFNTPGETIKEKFETLRFLIRNRKNIFSISCAVLEIRERTEYHQQCIRGKIKKPLLHRTLLSYLQFILAIFIARSLGVVTLVSHGTNRKLYSKLLDRWFQAYEGRKKPKLFNRILFSFFFPTTSSLWKKRTIMFSQCKKMNDE